MPPGSDHWVATKGVSRSLLQINIETPNPHGGTTKSILPPRESRFELLEYRNDDPEFTDAVFTISLPTGAYVWDPRIQKDYRQERDVIIRSRTPKERKPLFRAWNN